MFDFMEPYLADGFSLLPVLVYTVGVAAILEEAEKGVHEDLEGKKLSLPKGAKFSVSIFNRQKIN
ncbi:MAG: hypothetical protein R3E89_05160 [Thiolinea sp.]